MSDVDTKATATEMFHESNERLRLATRAANVGFFDWNLLTDAVTYSREWKSQLGYDEHEIAGEFREWSGRVHPDDLGPTLERVQGYLLRQQSPHEIEFRMRHKDGSWRWIYSRGEVTRDQSGRPVRMLGCHVDITDRKVVEAALRASEERYRQLFELNLAGVFCLTSQGSLIDCNTAFARMLGYANKAELFREPKIDFYLTPGRHSQLLVELRQRGEITNCEIELRRRDGVAFWGLESAALVRGSDGTETVQGTIIDITEAKAMATTVRRSEVFLRAVIDAMDASTVVVDRTGQNLIVNRVWRDFAINNDGNGPTVMEGGNYLEVCERAASIHPAAATVGASLRAVLAGAADPTPVEYDCDSPQEKRRYQACIHGFQQGDERFALVTHQNVTGVRRAAEREAAAAEYSAVATIAAGVAHEFNSILLAAALQLHRISGNSADDAQGAHAKTSLLIQQAQSLAAALLDLYSAPGSGAAEPMDLQAWLPGTVARLAEALPPGIRVIVVPATDLPRALAHPLALEQVIRNLLINSADAIGENGEIRVRALRAVEDGCDLVELRVSDDGPGVPEQSRGRVFEPGFTTREGSHRSGLGLAIAVRLLAQIGGRVSYEPNLPRGSTFVIRLRMVPGGIK